MTGSPSSIEWHLARDGRQYGPLSESEMRAFVDLGHLRQSDLIWRGGFADWLPALDVFPPQQPAAEPPIAKVVPLQQPAVTQRVDGQQRSPEEDAVRREASRQAQPQAAQVQPMQEPQAPAAQPVGRQQSNPTATDAIDSVSMPNPTAPAMLQASPANPSSEPAPPRAATIGGHVRTDPGIRSTARTARGAITSSPPASPSRQSSTHSARRWSWVALRVPLPRA
jgi:GYF domain 2